MSKTYIKELQEQIENLNDGFEIKEVEKALLESEIEDTLSPYKLLSEQTGFLLEMLNEVIEFEKKKPSEKIAASKKRLVNLLFINTELNKVVGFNNTLKLSNRLLIGKIQMLRKTIADQNLEIMKSSMSNEY